MVKIGKSVVLLFSAALLVAMLNGCCVGIRTSVRNASGSNLTLVGGFPRVETNTLPISKTVLCGGVLGEPDDVWIISDGKSQFIYTNISLVATIPAEFVSHSRLNSDFPCLRITRHVMIAPDMAIHAERVIGYTEREPAGFPIWYTERKE